MNNKIDLIDDLLDDNAMAKLKSIQETLRNEYCKAHKDPWIVAYSGGKDSTLLLHLVWEMVLSLESQKRNRTIYVISNNTLVESPLVIDHIQKSISIIEQVARKNNLPIITKITRPNIDQTFWVNVIGKGYIPPTRNFRWCTDRLKIVPTDKFLKKIVAKHKRAVLLIGSRRSESQNRGRIMKKHGVKATKMNPHGSIKQCRMFSPIADLENDDVWMILMQRNPPWGGTHKNLITLYRNANGGECPLILTKNDEPSCGTTSPRFGCWTCTVVTKDKSMQGTIDSGHEDEDKLERLAQFRDWLIKLREKDANRMSTRRNGKSKFRNDGSRVYGPFKISIRKKILARLKKMEKENNTKLISMPEIDFIKYIWRIDELHEEGRASLENIFEHETA